MILAGGSGVRLWPMSRRTEPKQLIPFIGGRSLLEAAASRLEGLIPPERIYVCALEEHRERILAALEGWTSERVLGEPVGRDTLSAVTFGAAVMARRDPDATVAVFTADHLIEPVAKFQEIVNHGFSLVERRPDMLVTFGITPTEGAPGFGYLELGDSIEPGASKVREFREKPDPATAEGYFRAGPSRYLWNSGMFVWRASTLLECVRRYEPAVHEGILRIAAAWDTPERESTLKAVYPSLKKQSVDFGIMEPATRDGSVPVAAIPMPLEWLDVGSWPMFAKTCPADGNGNALAAERHLLLGTSNTMVASSDPGHVIAVVGCDDLIVVHTPDATLVCRAGSAQDIKKLHKELGDKFGGEYI